MEESAERRLGTWVRWARLERGWSQRHLASQLADRGVRLDPSGVTRLEKGQRPIRVDEAAALGEIFGVSVSEMLQPVNVYAKAADAANKTLALLRDAYEQREITWELVRQDGDINKQREDPEIETSRKQTIELLTHLAEIREEEAKQWMESLYIQAGSPNPVTLGDGGEDYDLLLHLENDEGGWGFRYYGRSTHQWHYVGPFKNELRAMACALILFYKCPLSSMTISRNIDSLPRRLPTVEELLNRISADRQWHERNSKEIPDRPLRGATEVDDIRSHPEKSENGPEE